MRAIVVVQDGRIIGETYGEGFNASTPLQGWSMTKTVNAALAGMAIKDGKLSLVEKICFRCGPATRARTSRWPI
nr:serine hydrolase [Bradyrhizobium sp. 139]